MYSNAGGNSITNYTLHHWKEGMKREDIKLKDLEILLLKSVFNEKGMKCCSLVVLVPKQSSRPTFSQ